MKTLKENIATFKSLTGATLPVMNAPMAGLTTPEMVVAVSSAGGLGVLAGDFLEAGEITSAVAAVRAQTDRPFAVNLRIPSSAQKSDCAPLAASLEALRRELGCPETLSLPDFEAQFQAVLEADVPVVRVCFGGFREIYADKLKAQGVRIIGAATTLREAKVQRAAGVDAVVVQGSEAGGPRLSFESSEEDAVGLLSLIGPASRATGLPIVAAGGIVTGRQMASCLVAGACAVEVGTYLVRTEQSALHEVYRTAMEFACDTDARLTRLISGRLTRALPGALFQALKDAGIEALAYPAHLMAMRPIYRAAARCGRDDLLPLCCGQSIPLGVPTDVAQALAVLIGDCRAVLQEVL